METPFVYSRWSGWCFWIQTGVGLVSIDEKKRNRWHMTYDNFPTKWRANQQRGCNSPPLFRYMLKETEGWKSGSPARRKQCNAIPVVTPTLGLGDHPKLFFSKEYEPPQSSKISLKEWSWFQCVTCTFLPHTHTQLRRLSVKPGNQPNLKRKRTPPVLGL